MGCVFFARPARSSKVGLGLKPTVIYIPLYSVARQTRPSRLAGLHRGVGPWILLFRLVDCMKAVKHACRVTYLSSSCPDIIGRRVLGTVAVGHLYFPFFLSSVFLTGCIPLCEAGTGRPAFFILERTQIYVASHCRYIAIRESRRWLVPDLRKSESIP